MVVKKKKCEVIYGKTTTFKNLEVGDIFEFMNEYEDTFILMKGWDDGGYFTISLRSGYTSRAERSDIYPNTQVIKIKKLIRDSTVIETFKTELRDIDE